MAENIEEIEKMMAVLLEDPEWIRLMSLALAEIDEDSAERDHSTSYFKCCRLFI